MTTACHGNRAEDRVKRPRTAASLNALTAGRLGNTLVAGSLGRSRIHERSRDPPSAPSRLRRARPRPTRPPGPLPAGPDRSSVPAGARPPTGHRRQVGRVPTRRGRGAVQDDGAQQHIGTEPVAAPFPSASLCRALLTVLDLRELAAPSSVASCPGRCTRNSGNRSPRASHLLLRCHGFGDCDTGGRDGHSSARRGRSHAARRSDR
jgi:hypothetical protein